MSSLPLQMGWGDGSARIKGLRLSKGVTASEAIQPAYPYEIWELIELVMASCPEDALKAFRKTIIGRGKPLTARMADAAIGGARTVLETGPLTGRGQSKHAEVPEALRPKLARLHWYLRHRMPLVFARAQGYEYTDEERELIAAARRTDVRVTFLEWSGEAVDRVAGPVLEAQEAPG